MPACKVCGRWFAKIRYDEELCDKCEISLSRLSGYAVPVVRCKDCKYTGGDFVCYRGVMVQHKPEDFCSYGERRGGGEDG